ncbi:MAG: ABC transporter permease [Lentisphaerales bacterium]|nr:ABC transporter permease [Lentisphaerales bacterium]
MNWRQIILLYKKELLEFVRDKRTFLIMLFVPALLYPGIIILTTELTAKQVTKQQKKVYEVGVKSDFIGNELVDYLKTDKYLEIVDQESPDFTKTNVFIEPVDGYAGALKSFKTATLKVHYKTADSDSRFAYDKVSLKIRKFKEELVEKRLKIKGLDKELIIPLKVEVQKVDQEVESRYLAGRVLPGIMLIMLVVGCSFIAQEIAAGEKERGTLETVLCSPLSRLELVCGKYLTVVTVGFLSAVINLGCMALTLGHMSGISGGDVESNPFANFTLPISVMPVILICLIIVAILVSGLTLMAASMARTVQEAGQYMVPITLVMSLPVIFSSLPGVEMEGVVRFVPFLNFCLLFQDLLIGEGTFLDFLSVAVSTGLFSVLVVTLLIKVYSSEGVLFNHEGRSTFSFNRSSLKERASFEANDSIIIFSIMLLLMFFVSTSLQTYDLGTSVLVSQWTIFFALSIALLKYFRVKVSSALYLKAPGPRNLLVCLFLAPFCYSAVMLMQIVLQYFGYKGAEMELFDIMATLTTEYGFLGTLFIISVTPAVCEEILFRGVLLSGLRREFNLKACMWLQAIMFGLAHFSFFRFAGTAVMGAVLTLIIFRTGSLYCTILMHMIFNALSCLIWAYDVPDKILLDNIWWIALFTIPGCSLILLLKPENSGQSTGDGS